MNVKTLIAAPILALAMPTLALAQDDAATDDSGAMSSGTAGMTISEDMFSRMDSDGSGSLSQDELNTAIEDGTIMVVSSDTGSSDGIESDAMESETGSSDGIESDAMESDSGSSDAMESEADDSMSSDSSDN